MWRIVEAHEGGRNVGCQKVQFFEFPEYKQDYWRNSFCRISGVCILLMSCIMRRIYFDILK